MHSLEEESLGRGRSHSVLLYNQGGSASSANNVGELIEAQAPPADLDDGRDHVTHLPQ